VNGQRVKVCIASMAPFVGGAEIAAERLGVGLQEAGHDVLLILGTRGEVYDRMVRAGLRCLHAPMYFTDKWHWFRYWRARRALRDLLRQERPDVLHSNDLPTHQILSDAAGGLGIPRVCHHRFPFSGTAIAWFNKYGAERHLFVSRSLMEAMCTASARLRDAERAVVYDGLPLPEEPTPDMRREARRALGLPATRALVTIAGQVIERKGVADLIRAWSLLEARLRAGATPLVVGDDLAGQGAYRAEMERLAAGLGVPALFVGFQKNVGDWLLASDIAVVPSHVEPLGNATLEAMSVALPVIGSGVGGIPEMIVHGQTGLLVPPRSPEWLAEALARLLGDSELRRCYGEQGRRRCQELFTLEAHTRAVCREYQHVLQPVEVL
jgi:glycosyltransferase involved in cell wall biosynthesis